MRLVLSIITLAISLALQSFELWLEPVIYKVAVGEDLLLNFHAGDNFIGKPWDRTQYKIERLTLIEKGPSQELAEKIPANKNTRMHIPITSAGSKLFSLKCKTELNETSAETFNEFLLENGLDEAYHWRVKNKQENRNTKAFVTRYSKLIVQAGSTLDDTWKNSVGHRLEITPTKNPASLKAGDYMDCRITYDGRPVPHIQVKVWGHVGNKIFLQNIYSEDDGTIRFPLSAPGPWLVSTIKIERSKTVGAEWESSLSTLVFNIE